MSDLSTGIGLLEAVKAAPTEYDRYLVYADWLTERGEDALAYAYRWAARHRLHPYRSPKGRACWWDRQGRGKRSPHSLPQCVFDAVRPRPKQVWQRRTWEAAFAGLASVLHYLRTMVPPEDKV